MIKIEHVETLGWEAAIRGMRNPMNSWEKSDSGWYLIGTPGTNQAVANDKHLREKYCIGNNDIDLMKRLCNAGTDHRKFMRMITVYMDITAPLYWWKEFDTYKVGTVANSCSTMHKIADKEFTIEDFSTEHLIDENNEWIEDEYGFKWCSSKTYMEITVNILNAYRYQYLKTKDKKYWWQMIQLLPSSYNQRRTVMVNYEVLANMYKSRRNHKLDEWIDFCAEIERFPHSELITKKEDDQK